MTKILLVTSHPVAPPWDSADKQTAASIARHLSSRYRFTLTRRAGQPSGLSGVRALPVLSASGVPTRLTMLQTTAWTALMAPRVDLLHIVMTLGPGTTGLNRALRLVRRWTRAAVVLSAPGVSEDARFPSGLCADAVVVTGAASRARLASQGIDARVIPAGIPLERWPLLKSPPNEVLTLMFAGHYDEAAGADESVEIACLLRERGFRCRLLLAMRPRDPATDRARRRALSSQAVVRGLPLEIVGTVSDTGDLFARADIVLMPGRRLAGKSDVPLVVLEALASGRPVVASDLPHLSPVADVVRRIPPGDALAGADVIEQLIRLEGTREALVARGRSFVEREASDHRMADEYARLYDELLAIRS